MAAEKEHSFLAKAQSRATGKAGRSVELEFTSVPAPRKLEETAGTGAVPSAPSMASWGHQMLPSFCLWHLELEGKSPFLRLEPPVHSSDLGSFHLCPHQGLTKNKMPLKAASPLRICHYHGCGSDLIPGLGTSLRRGRGDKKEERKKAVHPKIIPTPITEEVT